MMPGAGLYLPDTLSRPLDRTEAHAVRQKYFERKSSQDSDSSRKSLALSRLSSENVTKVFSSLPTVFDFADWVSTQGKVSSDNEVFIDLLQRVRHDVTEASRLYTSAAVADYLDSWPDKKSYIDRILHDIEKALNDIGLFLETVQISGDDGGTTGLRRKFQWALSHQKKLMSKQQLLTTCHQSLMPAVQLMQAAEMNATFDPIYELPAQHQVEDASGNMFRSPHSRQKWRSNRKSSSVPSITISEPDLNDDKIVRPYQHALAELPGSTPDDLHHHNQDLHSDFPEHQRHFVDETGPWSSQDNASPSCRNEATESSSSPTAEVKDTDETPRRRPPDPPLPRRSFDRAHPSTSIFEDRARASFDSARPRAYSDQMRTQPSFEMKKRSSHDQVRPLPTLTERPIERFNSTASVAVGDAISVPLASMRYRSKPVTVKKLPIKHNSLPSKLPSFPSQTSLMDDLSTWVIPPSARESYPSVQSIDTLASIGDSTPATSATSSPMMPSSPVSCPPVLISTISAVPPADSSLGGIRPAPPPVLRKPIPILPSRPAPPPPSLSIPPLIPPKIPIEQSSQPKAALQPRSHENLQRTDSTPIPPPLSRRRRPVRVRENPTIKDTIPKGLPVSDASPIPTVPVNGSPASAAIDIKVDATELSSQEHLPSSAPEQCTSAQIIVRHTVSSSSATDKYPIAVSPTDTPPVPSLPMQSPTSSATSVETLPSETPPAPTTAWPMTALAKRRAAHAKRMQMAFGSEEENA